jgi:hypothetical protein
MNDLLAVDVCPLCGSARRRHHSAPAPNLYSEMLARLTGVSEAVLLSEVSNVCCLDCGLVYKRNHLPRHALSRLFDEGVPDHPRGWDVVSGRFSANNFESELSAYREAIEQGDSREINRYRRSLASIVDSIPELAGREELLRLRKAILDGETATLQTLVPMLRSVMREPVPYGRFSGFSSGSLWAYLESKLGRIRTYAEIGCPLWGLLRHAQSQGCETVYLRRAEHNYWSSGCRRDGVHCVDHLVASTGIETAHWDECLPRRFDVIGAFQYLDHLDAPGLFMETLFHHAKAAAVIVDAIDTPVAIQHLTGWTSAAMIWLSRRLGCRLYPDFADIRPSGNQLFLLTRSE